MAKSWGLLAQSAGITDASLTDAIACLEANQLHQPEDALNLVMEDLTGCQPARVKGLVRRMLKAANAQAPERQMLEDANAQASLASVSGAPAHMVHHSSQVQAAAHAQASVRRPARMAHHSSQVQAATDARASVTGVSGEPAPMVHHSAANAQASVAGSSGEPARMVHHSSQVQDDSVSSRAVAMGGSLYRFCVGQQQPQITAVITQEVLVANLSSLAWVVKTDVDKWFTSHVEELKSHQVHLAKPRYDEMLSSIKANPQGLSTSIAWESGKLELLTRQCHDGKWQTVVRKFAQEAMLVENAYTSTNSERWAKVNDLSGWLPLQAEKMKRHNPDFSFHDVAHLESMILSNPDGLSTTIEWSTGRWQLRIRQSGKIWLAIATMETEKSDDGVNDAFHNSWQSSSHARNGSHGRLVQLCV